MRPNAAAARLMLTTARCLRSVHARVLQRCCLAAVCVASIGLSLAAPVAMLASTDASASGLAPEPNPIPTRWELDLRTGPLRVTTIDVAGEGPQMFYYLTYRVANYSGRDLLFAPTWELATDDTIMRAGRGVPFEVTEAIMDLLENPLLEDQNEILGTVQQGEENIREGLLVWPVGSVNTDEVRVYATGFSGENQSIRIRDPQTGRATRVVLRKTMMLRHATPGQVVDTRARAMERLESRWIMR
jgi:hypothetical protein